VSANIVPVLEGPFPDSTHFNKRFFFKELRRRKIGTAGLSSPIALREASKAALFVKSGSQKLAIYKFSNCFFALEGSLHLKWLPQC
jgi:hypothetical protein